MDELKEFIDTAVLKAREEFIAMQENEVKDAMTVLEKIQELSQKDESFSGMYEAVANDIKTVNFSSPLNLLINSVMYYFNGDFIKATNFTKAIAELMPNFAEELRKRTFTFDDLVILDDRAIQKVMREIDQQELAKALKSSSEEVKEKIFGNMSQRASSMLKEDMEFMGPVRRIDVEESQARIISIVQRLEDSGDILIIRPGEDEMIE